MQTRKKILVVEDDADIAQLLQLHLANEGFAITHASCGKQGLQLLEQGGWDALILDLMLPGVDGLDICRHARTMTSYTPIIIISARSSETHRVLGLDLGADDYLAKPFSMLELVARVKSLFRRQQAMIKDLRMDSGVLNLENLTINPISREVTLRQSVSPQSVPQQSVSQQSVSQLQLIDLTPREFDLLYFFARHPGQVFSRMDLLNHVWGYQHPGYEHTVNTHINRLRIKIEQNPADPQLIITVWGKGYKFQNHPVQPYLAESV